MKVTKPASSRSTLVMCLSSRPQSSRINGREYDREMYKRRNEIERLFRRLKGFRRIFSRFEKLDVMFIGFIHFALIVEAFCSVNRL
jgi:transposase